MNDEDLKKIKQVVLDVVKEEVGASEKRLEERLTNEISETEKRLSGELSETEKRIYRGIGDFISDEVLPQLEEKADKSDIERIERKLDKYIDQTSSLV